MVGFLCKNVVTKVQIVSYVTEITVTFFACDDPRCRVRERGRGAMRTLIDRTSCVLCSRRVSVRRMPHSQTLYPSELSRSVGLGQDRGVGRYVKRDTVGTVRARFLVNTDCA